MYLIHKHRFSFFSIILAVLLVLSVCFAPTSFVLASPDSSAEDTSIPSYLIQDETLLDVSVNDTLWIDAPANQNEAEVYTMTTSSENPNGQHGNLTVTNHLNAADIKVNAIQAVQNTGENYNGYQLIPYHTDFSKERANSHKYALAYDNQDISQPVMLYDTIAAQTTKEYPLTGKMSISTHNTTAADNKLAGHVVVYIGFNQSLSVHSEDDSREGNAYAVATNDNKLIFFRSNNVYSNGPGQTVSDIAGNVYQGNIYTDIEGYMFAEWPQERTDIQRVFVASGQTIAPQNINRWFALPNAIEVDVNGIDTSNVFSMEAAFYALGKDSASSEIRIEGLETWDTSQCVILRDMFNCGVSYTGTGRLTNASLLGIADWDVSNVINMDRMFYGQGQNLTSLNLSQWNVGNVENFDHMFCDCFQLTSLDLSSWDTHSAVTFYNMFDDCFALTTVGDISRWNTSALRDMAGLFNGCTSLIGKSEENRTILDLSHWDTSQVVIMGEAFRAVPATDILLNSWSTAGMDETADRITISSGIYLIPGYQTYQSGFSQMFKDCTNLTNIEVGDQWSTQGHPVDEMFANTGTDHVTIVS